MPDLRSHAAEAADRHLVTPPTARKWLGRYLAGGQAALAHASSRPAHSLRSIDSSKALLIVELRRRSMLQRQIARAGGVSTATVSRVLATAGLSKLSDLQLREPVLRYEHDAPGDLLHIDTKKLGRNGRGCHADHGAQFDQERRERARRGDEADEEGQPVVCVTNTGGRPVVLY